MFYSRLIVMLQFTKEIDYGLQLVVALAKLKKGEVLSLRKFSDASRISFLFLQRIVKKLREANLVVSNKGAHGGYFLKRPADRLSLREVIEAIDGECAVINCLSVDENCRCAKEKTCGARKFFTKVNDCMVDCMEKMLVNDII